MFVCHLAVPVPLRQLFSYTCEALLQPGCRVLVSFGSRQLVAVVIACAPDDDSQETATLKPIEKRLDLTPLINQDGLQLMQWLSDYYHYPVGETIATMLPKWLRQDKTGEQLEALVAEKFWTLTEQGRKALIQENGIRASHKAVLTQFEQGPLSKQHVDELISVSTLTTLRKKDWLTGYNKVPHHKNLWTSDMSQDVKPLANTEQGVAIGALIASLSQFSVTLLEGITGSGKTEVYLQVIEQVLLNGQQVLVLIPEIGLTPQTLARFEKRFNCEIGVLNSSVSDRQRGKIWMQAKLGLISLVIGTRSAVFTPFKNLGFIVIDEEHDDALKQQDGLRYHARDVAAVRAQRANIPLLLGSATPSLESLNNALSGRYRHIQLTQRAARAQTVTQHLLDLKHLPIQTGIAEAVIEQMRSHLHQGHQVLLFLNRRGYAPVLMCHDCGHVETCNSCSRPMTWHKQRRRMECHHCDIQRPVPHKCQQCGSHNLLPEGIGTEQLEHFIKQTFPHYPCARIDRDSTRKKDAFDALFEDVHSGKTKILIGTQMLAKGHHFPDVTLVVIIDVDGGLFSLDNRSQEKLAQLITQLSGRAGRADKKGEMVLQTHHPEHPMLQELVNNGYGHVARLLLAERKSLNSPPYYAQAAFRAESADEEQCQSLLARVKQSIASRQQVATIGPMPALIEKRQNRFRYILLVRAPNRRSLHGQLHNAMRVLDSDKLAKKVRWSLDVDAIDLT